jgi:heme exporter protein D
MTMGEFFHMGGYAFYVWTSYGLTLIILLANILAPLRQRRKILADLARRERRARSMSQ